ncbi:hypothetical protein QQF64_014323 [Cirrhinus molitorella]|uniref:Death domain-containing protein n=1 Tax=Cirrhinus molitorella TaxID=172907 RepID=A0ABR3NRQ8_9TELE
MSISGMSNQTFWTKSDRLNKAQLRFTVMTMELIKVESEDMSYSEPCGEKDGDTEEPRDLMEVKEELNDFDEKDFYYQNSSDFSPAEKTGVKSYDSFLPFYQKKLAANVKADLEPLMTSYEGPEMLVEKLKSLKTETLTPEDPSMCSRDSPAPLRSSDIGPVEASIEDLSFRTPEESLLEMDAAPPSSPNLELKLAQEYNYHKYGSRIVDQPDASVYNPLPQQPASSRWPGEVSSSMSSVKSWAKPAACSNPEEELHPRPASSIDGFHKPELASQLSMPYSDYDRLQHPHHPPYDRFKSCPDGSQTAESFMLDSHPGLRFSPVCPPSDSGWPVSISNASAIQIGSYNTMNLRVSENSSFSSSSSGSINKARYNELLLKFEEHMVTENHLEVVRQNVGGNWKQVARKLGLTDIDVDTIEHDYDRDGLAEKVHQTLERWKMKEGLLGITVGKLCRALEGCIKFNVLLQLLLKCQDVAGVP